MGYGSFHRHFTIYSRTIARITLKIHNGSIDLQSTGASSGALVLFMNHLFFTQTLEEFRMEGCCMSHFYRQACPNSDFQIV